MPEAGHHIGRSSTGISQCPIIALVISSMVMKISSLAVLTGCLVAFYATSAWSLDGPQPQPSGPKAGKPAGKRESVDSVISKLRGEWKRNGATFACVVPSPEKLPPKAITPEVLGRACLHMGSFVIGGAAATLQATLGSPHRTVPQPKGATGQLYFLEGQERHPYLVATVLRDKIVALQLTGPAAAKGYLFNHVDLGAGADTVLKHFGPPKNVAPSGLKDTELWSYRPWPFSFEVKDDRVTSIRIADPEY